MEQIQHPQSNVEAWHSLRQEFGGEEAPINSVQSAAELVNKWIWIDHQQEFQEYEKQLQVVQDGLSLNQLIEQTIAQDKEQSWKIPQNFSLTHVQGIIAKARVLIKNTIDSLQTVQPPQSNIKQPEIAQQPLYSQVPSLPPQAEPASPIKNQFLQSGSIQLPQIKPRPRLYQPRQLNRSFHLLQQTQQQYQVRSPSMFQSMRPQAPRGKSSSLFNNKWLKRCFYAFCRQCYSQKRTFSSAIEEGEKMNMNKWMVFCKQFDFNSHFPLKDLISTYQTATHFKSSMCLEEFLNAVAMMREKYVSKYNSGDNFVKDVLRIDSEAALRVKLQNRKIKYCQYTKNFFEQATYPEPLRLEEERRQKEFYAKKKERETVLVKGMLADHIQHELGQRKAQRQQKKQINISRINKSHTFSLPKQQQQPQMQRNPSLPKYPTHSKKEGYARVFAEKKSGSQMGDKRQDRNYNTAKTVNSSKLMSTDFPNNSSMGKSRLRQVQQKLASTKVVVNPQRTAPAVVVSKSKEGLPRREWPQPAQSHSQEQQTWLTRIRSDSEQSDDILRQHLESEKKAVAGRQNVRLQQLMRQMEGKKKKVEQYRRQMVREQQREQQQDGDMAQTRPNFTVPLKLS